MTYFYITVFSAIAVLSAIHLILKKVFPAKTRGEYLIEIMKEKDEELFNLMAGISGKLNCTLEAVVFTHYAMVKNTEKVNDEDTACENFIMLVNDIYSNPRKGILSLQLKSSKDIDSIVKELVQNKIVSCKGNYSFSNLDQVFEELVKS